MSNNPYKYEEGVSSQLSMKRLNKVKKRSVSGQNLKNMKTKVNKVQLQDIVTHSPYAQVRNVSKQRSSNNLRQKLIYKSISTPMHVSESINNSSSKNKSQSSLPTNPQKDQILGLRKKFFPQSLKPNTSSSKLIEDKLLETLNKVKSTKIETGKFEAYRTAFADIIEKDEQYGSLLKKIKEVYEQKIKYEKIDVSHDIIEQLKEDLRNSKEKLLSRKKEKKMLMKKIEKFVKENVEISRSLAEWEEKYFDLQEKLVELSRVDLGSVKMDELSWKFIVSENNHLAKLCQNMKEDLRMLSKKEKRLVKLVVVLKEKGYPVEEVYEGIMSKKSKQKARIEFGEQVEDDTENEDLVSGKARSVKKPEFVPCLDFDALYDSQEEWESSEFSGSEDAL